MQKATFPPVGFTLIELLVVVLIIGILASIALPQYQKAVEKSRSAEAIVMLKNAHQAYELLRLGGTMPGDVSPKDVVDWSAGTWSSDGWHFCTKKFFYEIAHPDIYAIRSDNIKSDCSGFSNDLYTIDYGFPEETGEVVCFVSSDVGYAVCKGLVSQGFELRDER